MKLLFKKYPLLISSWTPFCQLIKQFLQFSSYFEADMTSNFQIISFYGLLMLGMTSYGHGFVRIASIRSTSIMPSSLPSKLTAINPSIHHHKLSAASSSQVVVEAAPSKLAACIFRLAPILRTIIHPTVAGGLLAGGLHAVTGIV